MSIVSSCENEGLLSQKNYHVLWFDLDDTLMDFKKSQREAFFGLCSALGYEDETHYSELHNLYETYNHPLWKQLEAGTISMDHLRYHRIAGFLAAIGEKGLWPIHRTNEQITLAGNPQAVADLYEGLLSAGDNLLDGTLSALNRLSHHYRMAIITNGIRSVQTGRLSKSPITPLFEEIVISETIGCSKPDSRIFEHTAQLMGLTADQNILMIGDSLASDIAGGTLFSIDTCWFNPNSTQNTTNLKPTFTISHLSQLAAMLCPHLFNGNEQYDQLQRLISLRTEHSQAVLMRIDGYCGSGKTTLGSHLVEFHRGQLVSLDHFFLPEALKTPERQATPGHNVHYERFFCEVLKPLSEGRPACYRPYNCIDGSYGAPITVRPEGLIVVEGSYSGHPNLESFYDLKVFVKTTQEMQLERILTRSGEKGLKGFIQRWIPYEMAYFKAYPIEQNSDIVIVT